MIYFQCFIIPSDNRYVKILKLNMKLLNTLCKKYWINLRTILSVNVTNAKLRTYYLLPFEQWLDSYSLARLTSNSVLKLNPIWLPLDSQLKELNVKALETRYGFQKGKRTKKKSCQIVDVNGETAATAAHTWEGSRIARLNGRWNRGQGGWFWQS